jgi:hypothetical protein
MPVPEVPEDLIAGPFTVARARELGVGAQVLRGERWRTPFPGVRVVADYPDDVLSRCAAAALVLPASAAFSHETAVRLHDLPTPLGATDRPDRLHVSVPRGVVVPRLPALAGHELLWDDPTDVVHHNGLRLTSVRRTVCDLASAGWPLEELVVLGDAAIRNDRQTTRALLHARVRAWAGRRGARRLREMLALIEDRVDSPMETRVRLLLLRAGLPRAEVNVPVRDEEGEYLHTPDLAWRRWRVALDYDGAHHFPSVDSRGDQWRRRQDIARKEMLEAHGWILRVVTSYDVLVRPDLTVSRVRLALRQRGARV